MELCEFAGLGLYMWGLLAASAYEGWGGLVGYRQGEGGWGWGLVTVASFNSLAILVSVSMELLRDCNLGLSRERDWRVGCPNCCGCGCGVGVELKNSRRGLLMGG